MYKLIIKGKFKYEASLNNIIYSNYLCCSIR